MGQYRKDHEEIDKIEVGSKIDVFLERIENFKGQIVVSREKAKRMSAWNRMQKVFESGEEVTGYITGRVKGGYICVVDSLPTFMPASQLDISQPKRVDHLMNIPLKVIATRLDKVRGNVCTSRKAVLEKARNRHTKERVIKGWLSKQTDWICSTTHIWVEIREAGNIITLSKGSSWC